MRHFAEDVNMGANIMNGGLLPPLMLAASPVNATATAGSVPPAKDSTAIDSYVPPPAPAEIRINSGNLDIHNPSLALPSETRAFHNKAIFGGGEDYPPAELVQYLTSIFIDPRIRVELSHVPRDKMVAAVIAALKESVEGEPDIYRSGAERKLFGLIPITVNGEKMHFALGLIEVLVRKHLFGREIEERADILSRLDAESPRADHVPRTKLATLALDEKGELQAFDDVRDLITMITRREGLPDKLLNNVLERHGINKFQIWSGSAYYHELCEGCRLTDYLDATGKIGWRHQQFPNLGFKYVVTLFGPRDSAAGGEQFIYDVRYFYDLAGHRMLTMIIERKGIVAPDEPGGFKELEAKTVFIQGEPAELFSLDSDIVPGNKIVQRTD